MRFDKLWLTSAENIAYKIESREMKADKDLNSQ